MTAPPTPDELNARLLERILDLVNSLIPEGQIIGREWVGHGPDGSKWGVVIAGRKTGYFQNFGTGCGGQSPLALIRDAACAGNPKAAYVWALKYLGNAVLLPAPRPQGRPRMDKSDNRAQISSAQMLWQAAKPFRWEDPGGLYLEGRGLARNELGTLDSLRYHHRCWNSDTKSYLPAMLAAVVDPATGERLAVHRTYLERDADGRWRKSTVRPAKKVLGPIDGGVIALTRGASGTPLHAARLGDGCLIAEGIENALTVAQWFPELRALACIVAGNLSRVALPDPVGSVMLVRDRDGENAAIQENRCRAQMRWEAEGRDVRLWEPPDGCKDANAYWQDVRAGARDP